MMERRRAMEGPCHGITMTRIKSLQLPRVAPQPKNLQRKARRRRRRRKISRLRLKKSGSHSSGCGVRCTPVNSSIKCRISKCLKAMVQISAPSSQETISRGLIVKKTGSLFVCSKTRNTRRPPSPLILGPPLLLQAMMIARLGAKRIALSRKTRPIK